MDSLTKREEVEAMLLLGVCDKATVLDWLHWMTVNGVAEVEDFVLVYKLMYRVPGIASTPELRKWMQLRKWMRAFKHVPIPASIKAL